MRKKEMSKKIIFYTLLATFMSILNSFFYSNLILMLLLLVVQMSILVFYLFTNQNIKYLAVYIIFLSTSLESATFVGTDEFYGFKNFKLLGINVALIFLLLFFVVILFKKSLVKIRELTDLNKKILFGASFLFISGIFMGLINILMNDNSIATKMSGVTMFIDSFYMYTVVIIELFILNIVIGKNEKSNDEIKAALIGIIYSIAITLMAAFLLSNFGNRGGLDSLQVSNIVMLLVASVGMLFYEKKRNVLLFAIAASVIFVLGIIFNTNGKMIIIALFLPLIGAYLLLRRKQYKTFIGFLLFGVLGILLVSNIILPMLIQNNLLFKVKYEQAIKLLSFWEPDWYLNLPYSPKIRISQIINIISEYSLKPFQFIFGKGYLGTIRDHSNLFGEMSEFTYSNWEITNGLFYMMHETFNNLFLVNGLIGVIYFIFVSLQLIKRIHFSPWILIGFFWFILFFNYSFTISIYGVSALIVGINDSYRNIKTYLITGFNEEGQGL